MRGASAGAPPLPCQCRVHPPETNQPRRKEKNMRQHTREEHEAAHVPSRDWCTHCMAGRGRTRDHVTKQKTENHVKTSWQMWKTPFLKAIRSQLKGL